ncbi:hypothetical protein KCP77_19340 [Salmonella enterica subsp. enterica]|nr:hypothetical protein KCP77_19340 [Salmonella enterica subsp. enterica]
MISLLIGQSQQFLIQRAGRDGRSINALVFRDPILGTAVAGMQLSANDMLKLGDWLEMCGNMAQMARSLILATTVKYATGIIPSCHHSHHGRWFPTRSKLERHVCVRRTPGRSALILTRPVSIFWMMMKTTAVNRATVKPYLTSRHPGKSMNGINNWMRRNQP